MKQIQVEIVGESPLIMNNPESMLTQDEKTVLTTKKRNLAEEAKALLYKMDNGELYVPARAVKGCLIGAASYKKFGKFSAKPIIAAAVRINPEKISLKTKEYELYTTTVVIQKKNRVVKSRPMLTKWKLDFVIEYDPNMIASGELIKDILVDGGSRVGLLDFRPAKLGEFGRFKVEKWQEK